MGPAGNNNARASFDLETRGGRRSLSPKIMSIPRGGGNLILKCCKQMDEKAVLDVLEMLERGALKEGDPTDREGRAAK